MWKPEADGERACALQEVCAWLSSASAGMPECHSLLAACGGDETSWPLLDRWISSGSNCALRPFFSLDSPRSDFDCYNPELLTEGGQHFNSRSFPTTGKRVER
jgi:hypothetical protein